MRFKIDENLPRQVARLLEEAGHEAMSVGEQGLSGAPDDDLFDICKAEDRVMLTLDLDFADIRAYPPEDSPGVVVLRPRRQDLASVLVLARALVPALDEHPLRHRLWIVEERRIRIRE